MSHDPRRTVVPPSSFTRGQYHPTISHAVRKDEERTLCGRDCKDWIVNELEPWNTHKMEPDCLTCRKVLAKERRE